MGEPHRREGVPGCGSCPGCPPPRALPADAAGFLCAPRQEAPADGGWDVRSHPPSLCVETRRAMDIDRVGVVGCGLMGSGLAEAAARAGLDVRVVEANQER